MSYQMTPAQKVDFVTSCEKLWQRHASLDVACAQLERQFPQMGSQVIAVGARYAYETWAKQSAPRAAEPVVGRPVRELTIGDVEPREDLPARGVPVFASQTVFDPLALDYVVGADTSRQLEALWKQRSQGFHKVGEWP